MAPRDVTAAFEGLASGRASSNRLEVTAGSNSIVFSTDESLTLALPSPGGMDAGADGGTRGPADGGVDAGTPSALGAVLALPVGRAVSARC